MPNSNNRFFWERFMVETYQPDRKGFYEEMQSYPLTVETLKVIVAVLDQQRRKYAIR